MKHPDIIKKMTLEEKIALCSGQDFWHTKAFDHLNIPSFLMSDGPHGIRKQEAETDMLGVHQSIPSTCYPTAVLSACSWDPKVLQSIGNAVALEARHFNVSLVLGPGANIKRNPLCGRNFEYFSEDPLLSGKLAAAQIRAIENEGVGSTIKHFALNNQETHRFISNSIVDQRALHEIYLRGFELAIKEGKPSAVMSAYNKIDGISCSSNSWLLNDLLRNDWGFKGFVVSDWGGMVDRLKSFEAGCNLRMPGGSNHQERETKEAVGIGQLNEAHIDACVDRILDFVFQSIENRETLSINWKRHHELAREVAEQSAVLLKNENAILPLKEDTDMLLVGHMAQSLRIQGSGSSRIHPKIQNQITELCPNIPFVKGFDAQGNTNEQWLNEVLEKARTHDRIVVFAGLPESYESEGFDRTHMCLPEGQNQVIKALAQVNPNIIVVLMSGSVVEIPWEDDVKAILYMGLPGQAGAEAILNLLFGKVNPSGKLAETWPLKQSDVVNDSYYAQGKKDAHYRESIFVGYRYYQSANVPVRYTFGHGLSYTQFSTQIIELTENTLRVRVENTGKRSGKAVVQVYVQAPEGSKYRPALELKAFEKVELDAQSSTEVIFKLDASFFAIYDDAWVTPSGTYTLHVGGGLDDLQDKATLSIQANTEPNYDNLPAWYQHPQGIPSHETWEKLMGRSIIEPKLIKGQFTMENTVLEMKDQSWIMKAFYHATYHFIAKSFKGKANNDNPEFKMILASATDATLSAMKVSGGIQNYTLEGILAMANGHWIEGFRLLLKKDKKA